MRMFVNTLNFSLWLFLWFKDLLYVTLVILPQRLAVGFYQWLLFRLPPVVRTCLPVGRSAQESWCELNDVGKSLVVVVGLLGLVWLLRRRSRNEHH